MAGAVIHVFFAFMSSDLVWLQLMININPQDSASHSYKPRSSSISFPLIFINPKSIATFLVLILGCDHIGAVCRPRRMAGRRYLETMSMSKMKNESFDLHEDVIVKILCRLPVKSLIRFTCVSKRWRSIIIADPQFGKSHLQVASQQGTLCPKILISIYPTIKTLQCQIPYPFEDDTPWLPSRFQSLEGYSSVKNLTFPSEEKSQRVMASCNGLVLLGESCESYFKNLSIWNPSTGFFRKIPSPSFGFEVTKSTEKKKYRSFLYYGFGQVTATDDYKPVLIKPALGDFVDVHVFSLRANLWKVIKAPSSSCCGWIDGQGSLSNGAIHWVNYPIYGVSDPTMVAFDLAEEEFRQVPLPVFNQNEDGVHLRQISIQVLLGGCLCVWSQDLYGRSEFWVMR